LLLRKAIFAKRMGAISNALFVFIKGFVNVWGTLFGWIYSLFTRPDIVRKNHERIRARPTKEVSEGDTEVVYLPEKVNVDTPFMKKFQESGCETMADVWNWSVKNNNEKKMLGTRDILGEEDEIQPNGKMFKKLDLGGYRWITYEEADSMADNFGRGLRVVGHESNQPICMYADTRVEWLLSVNGAFKQGFPVVTIYTNLGEDAVVHGLQETEVEIVVTSHELLPKFKKILAARKDKLKTIVYIENPIKQTDVSGFRDDVRLISYWEVLSLGKKTQNNNLVDTDAEPTAPTPDSAAIIMYTSGSTGNPKGVILTHKNLVSALNSLVYCFNAIDGDTYIAYLPLAHVLELLAESMMVLWGVQIGYSTPNTLTDKSSMIKRGQKGDATILKPSLLFCVPLILDRMFKGVTEQVKKKGNFVNNLINFFVNYKLERTRSGEITPIIDKVIFKSIRQLVGGRVRVMLSGGAPLAPDTHDYLKTVFGLPLLQGYGLTETCATATIMNVDENSTGRVGPPVQNSKLKLINWEEGNYRVTDKPHPRGEVILGGNQIAKGYYKLPEKTDEEFYTDDQGTRWFMTGDIGEVYPDGTLMIIDRKKDLTKLQFGEYVSLGKVEACLKGCPVISNICVYGSSSKSFVVAIICPAPHILKELAAAKHGKGDLTFEEMCDDKDVTGTALREIVNYGKAHKLEKFEIPGAIHLTSIEWTPDTGLTTAAMKLKRRPLQEYYQNDINRMYGDK